MMDFRFDRTSYLEVITHTVCGEKVSVKPSHICNARNLGLSEPKFRSEKVRDPDSSDIAILGVQVS